jgi:cobalt/nickel transport system permease protein
MHISEGVLSTPVVVASYTIATTLVALGIKKANHNDISKIALVSALFFVASTIHIPIGVTSAHFMLLGVIGIVLGWYSFVALFVALLLQALLIGFGGISSLGVNVLNTGIGAISAYYIYKLLKDRLPFVVTTFLVGAIPVFIASLGIAIALMFSNEEFLSVAKMALIMHIPLALIEGVLMIFIFRALAKYQIEEFKI